MPLCAWLCRPTVRRIDVNADSSTRRYDHSRRRRRGNASEHDPEPPPPQVKSDHDGGRETCHDWGASLTAMLLKSTPFLQVAGRWAVSLPQGTDWDPKYIISDSRRFWRTPDQNGARSQMTLSDKREAPFGSRPTSSTVHSLLFSGPLLLETALEWCAHHSVRAGLRSCRSHAVLSGLRLPFWP